MGKAQFRSSGNFEIRLYNPSCQRRKYRPAAAFYDRDGIYLSTYNKRQVFNCRISLESQENGEMIISGIRLRVFPKNETAADTLSAATILMRFIEEINKAGIIIKNIERMYSGYKMDVLLSSLELKPVWRIDTDSVTYYMDAVEGVLIKI
jgi:hypothetical protein